MRLTDEQRALLAERLADLMLSSMDGKTMERMVYDMYLDEYLMMDEEDLLVEADMYEVEVPSALVI
jgi:hypothetical protein